MPNKMTPAKARRLLSGATSVPWSAHDGDGAAVDSTNRLLFWPGGSGVQSEPGVVPLVVAAPDLARAYLAEHARADAAEAERDRLADRVAELEIAAPAYALAAECGTNPD